MKRLMRIASIVLGMVLVASMTSCEKHESWIKSSISAPHAERYEYFIQDGFYWLDVKPQPIKIEKARLFPSISIDPCEIVVEGETSFKPLEDKAHLADPWKQVEFAYNYDTCGIVKARDVVMIVVINDVERPVYPRDSLIIEGSFTVETLQVAPFSQKGVVTYVLKDVHDQVAPCKPAKQVLRVKGTETVTLTSREFSFEHLAWVTPSRNNNNITLKCKNKAQLNGVYSNGSVSPLGDTIYFVENHYKVQGLQNVTFPREVEGNTYNFDNGNVTVAGNGISLVHQGDEVVGDVIFDGINYKESIDPCHATPLQISFNSGYATITFVDEEGERVIVNFDVDYQSEDDEEEEVTLIGVTKSFEHMAFRQNATVSGNQISLICDNIATFVSNYSNGTASSPAHVDYTVTNRYNVAIGTLSTEYVGTQATFTHNGNGVYTATIGGVNVTLNYQGTTVANIIYNGVNYKNSAPQCLATPSTIALVSSSQARITFKHVKENGTVEVITATIAVTTQTPITGIDFLGQVVKAYISDSYVSNASTAPEEWLHVLVEHNGSYKVYSAPWQNGLGISSFEYVDVSAHFTVLSNLADNEAIAKVYHHDGGLPEIGIVQGQQYSTGGWKITYLDFNRDIENMLEFSMSTISNYNGRNPKRLEKIGSGVVNHNGITINIQ